MILKELVDDIRRRLEKEEFTSEADVCDNIVRRLLHEALGWPRYERKVVIREHPVEGGKVDFALCYPESTPRVFIEVKKVGNIEGASCLDMLIAEEYQSLSSPMVRNGNFFIQWQKWITENARYTR